MKYLFLNDSFYEKYNQFDYPEIERKSSRPYIMVKINIDGLNFGIPLRSGISHSYALWTDKENKCGVDYSKAVLIPDETYIDDKKPHIRENEFHVLKDKDHMIQSGFKAYIEKYKNALSELHIERNKKLCKFSTLQYFHIELKII
jgi:protein AbiQ